MSIPDWARRGRAGWKHTGARRPDFAIEPAPGQESVWDYPRPPRLASDVREFVVRWDEVEVARTTKSLRVLETASPPTFYLPPDDVRTDLLEPATGGSRCEWKGETRYWSLVSGGRREESVAWSYPEPLPGFEALKDFLGFYPARLGCTVDGAVVAPQPGRFYGGWVTAELVGPFKGEPGTEGW